MKLTDYLQNRAVRNLIIAGFIIVLISIVLRLFNIDLNEVKQLVNKILGPYLSLVAIPANTIIGWFTDGVTIRDHVITFNNYHDYYAKNQDVIDDWPSYLLYLKWTAFLLLSIWLTASSIRKKLVFTTIFALTHYLAVLSGLVMIAGIGPLVVDPDSLSELRPHSIGSFAMFAFFLAWFRNSIPEIRHSLSKINVKFDLSRKKLNEILFVWFIFLLLRNFLVPYFNYYGYIDFLLKATQKAVALFGYNSTIDGPYIIGDNNGTLFMAKWCLGFLTMYLFGAMVFLTRVENLTAWIYIGIGFVILHIFNILRLSALFIFVQYYDDSDLIMDHHTIYNIVVYVIIFIMWVIWFEKYTSIRMKKRSSEKPTHKPDTDPSQ